MLALVSEVVIKERDDGKVSYGFHGNCTPLQDSDTGEQQKSTPAEDAMLRQVAQRFAEVLAELMGPPDKAWSRIHSDDTPQAPVHDMDGLMRAADRPKNPDGT